jgi:hypothetical protein
MCGCRYISLFFWAFVSLTINEYEGACCWCALQPVCCQPCLVSAWRGEERHAEFALSSA